MRSLKQVINTRVMEIREKLQQTEKSQDGLEEEQFSANTEAYLMNRVKGTPIYEEDESI